MGLIDNYFNRFTRESHELSNTNPEEYTWAIFKIDNTTNVTTVSGNTDVKGLYCQEKTQYLNKI